MHKELLLLGLLQSGHNIGYDLHRIVTAHGELYNDLKRGNVYYLLDRLAESGALTVTAEPGARGPRRERLVYAITERGLRRFHELLREVMLTYEPPHTGVEVGVSFLSFVPPAEAIQLLEARRQAVLARRALLDENRSRAVDHLYIELAQDHLRSLIDAELAWIKRTAERLRQAADHAPTPST